MNGSEAPEYQKRTGPTVVNGHNLEVGNVFFGTKRARDLPRNRLTNKKPERDFLARNCTICTPLHIESHGHRWLGSRKLSTFMGISGMGLGRCEKTNIALSLEVEHVRQHHVPCPVRVRAFIQCIDHKENSKIRISG